MQVFLEECKYNIEENKTEKVINDELNVDWSDDQFDETDELQKLVNL